jgi:hypothetical protein
MAIADVSQQPLTALISLKGRLAVVTGGARGIGKAISHHIRVNSAGAPFGSRVFVDAYSAPAKDNIVIGNCS